MRIVLTLFLVLCVAPWWSDRAGGQDWPVNGTGEERDLPFVFRADAVDYDRESGVVTVRGAVHITQGDRTLMADEVAYDQVNDTLTAKGNVSLTGPTGDVLFADRVELSGDFKRGLMEGLRIRMADDSRIAAVAGRRTGGFLTEMRKAVYSPCRPCEEDPLRAPIWQIKAVEVSHDEVSKEIEYTDAWLEFFGVPVAYVPYFSHPDPSVKKRTGILVPSYGNDSELGVIVRLPFFVNLGPEKDATITPIFTGNEGFVLAGEYRHLFSRALLNVTGSATHAAVDTGKDEFRGHLFTDLGVDLTSAWRAKMNVALSSDDTYLRRYKFDSRDTLTSRVQVEGFWNRSYASGNAYYFQGLRAEDDPDRTPLIAPVIDYKFVSQPDGWGGVWSVGANALSLTRSEGADSRRVSLETGWQVPYTSPIGDRYRLFASVRADGYSVENYVDPGNPNAEFTGVDHRVFPQAGIDWRYPFVRPGESVSLLVEPIAGVIFAPNVGREDKIPNEDSLDIELDDTNIFAVNRLTGLDRIEGGHRVYYGLRAGLFGPGDLSSRLFLGQSYRRRENRSFPAGSGLEDQRSDYVGRFHLQPVSWADVIYRFRLTNELRPQRHEVTARLGEDRFRLTTDYIFVARSDPLSEFGDREEINVELAAKLTDRWSIGGTTRHDLADDGGPLLYGAKIAYADDCFSFLVEYKRTFFRDRDVRPSDSVMFRVGLRTLGSLGSSSTP